MSEYLDYPAIPNGFHIDNNFGREYDPYPQNRRTQTSWVSNGLPSGTAGSTPHLRTRGVTSPGMSPVPDVHRMDRSMEYEAMRSPLSPHTVSSPRPAMPGASRFREIDQPEPSHWTGPTNVSYPASLVSGVPQQRPRADTLSTFAPRNASTPAPERQEGYSGQSPHYGGYGVADEQSFSRLEEPGQDASYGGQQPYYDEYAEDDGVEEEEMNVNDGSIESVTIPGGMGPDVAPAQDQGYGNTGAKKKSAAERFVGGFMLGLRNVPKLMSRSHPAPVAQDPTQFAPQFSTTPIPDPAPPFGQPQQPVTARTPPPQSSPAQSRSPPSSSYAPSYAQEDSTQSSNTTSSQMIATPPLQSDDPDLPNPHDSRVDTPRIVSDPEQADMRPASDYDAMSPPIHTIDPFESTMSSHVNRVGKAIVNFAHMPWIGSHVSESYSPFQSRRAHFKDLKKGGTSWYTKEIQEKVDLLAGSPVQRRARPAPRPRQDNAPGPSQRRHARTPPLTSSPLRDTATAIRPTQTPRSITSAGAGHMQSPGASSHGHGHHSYSYSYHYPTQGMPLPQPIIIYPGPSPVVSPTGQAPEGVRSPASPRADGQQPTQYMYYTAPATFIVPTGADGQPRRSGSRQYHPQFPVPIIMTPPMQTIPTPALHTSPPQRATSPRATSPRAAPSPQPLAAASPRPREGRVSDQPPQL